MAQSPGDENARLAYADWLCDHRRDAEGERQKLMIPGYRVLVQLERMPLEIDPCNDFPNGSFEFDWNSDNQFKKLLYGERAFHEWWEYKQGRECLPSCWAHAIYGGPVSKFPSLTAAFDAAALAFARLDGKKRTWLLNLAEKFAARNSK